MDSVRNTPNAYSIKEFFNVYKKMSFEYCNSINRCNQIGIRSWYEKSWISFSNICDEIVIIHTCYYLNIITLVVVTQLFLLNKNVKSINTHDRTFLFVCKQHDSLLLLCLADNDCFFFLISYFFRAPCHIHHWHRMLAKRTKQMARGNENVYYV